MAVHDKMGAHCAMTNIEDNNGPEHTNTEYSKKNGRDHPLE